MILCKGCSKRHICSDFESIKRVAGKLELAYCDRFKKEEWSELKEMSKYELQELKQVQN